MSDERLMPNSDAPGNTIELEPGLDPPGESPQDRAKHLPLAPPRVDAVPELIPARMVNEVLYCERLMYLEWVQAEWADNRFTIEGKAVHKRVDGKSQVLKPRSRKTNKADATAEADKAQPHQPEPDKAGEQSKANDKANRRVANDPVANDPDEEKPYTARSVWLSSERLGITAKIDVVDVDGHKVVPIEYKRGKEPKAGPYLPERAQVGVQVMLLREHGYDCSGGELYFAAEKRRVSVELDEQLEATVLEAVARARELSLAGKCPPPLEDNPKCIGCSLSGICLPDEVQALDSLNKESQEEDDAYNPFDVGDDPWDLAGPEPDPEFARPVRRLFPARDDKIPLYIQARGASIRIQGDRLIVMNPGEKSTDVRLTNTSSVTLLGNVQITTQAQRRLMEEGIPLIFATSGGWIVGRAIGSENKNVELRAAQYLATSQPHVCLKLAKEFVRAKILNCRTMLRRNHREAPKVALFELKQLARKAGEAPAIDSLLGIEGSAARVYFQAFSGMLKAELQSAFQFDSRNRRPPRDAVNALLSFCYTLLVRETTMAAHCVGLDPLLGFYHQPRFGRASLALDLMEEFRPILADSTVISVINNGAVGPDDFVHGQGAVALKPPARKRVIQTMERRMDQLVTHPIFDYRLSYRRVLEVQARLLSRVLLAEVERYPGFRVR